MSKTIDWSDNNVNNEWGDWERVSQSQDKNNDFGAASWDDVTTTTGTTNDPVLNSDDIEWGVVDNKNTSSYNTKEKQDLAEKFDWAKKKVSNDLSNYNGPVDKETLTAALSKLSMKAFKEMSKVLDEDDYDAMCVIMDAVGFKEEFIKETQGGSSAAIATPIMDEALDQLNDIMVGMNAIKHPMYYKLQSMAMIRVNGGKPKVSEFYEMLQEMVKHKLINPEQVGTDASKMELSLCLNKMKEYYKNNNSSDFGFDGGWDINGSATTDDWGSWDTTPTNTSSNSNEWNDVDDMGSSGGSLFSGGNSRKRKNEEMFDDLGGYSGTFGNSKSNEPLFEI